jgi:hypothetical protein
MEYRHLGQSGLMVSEIAYGNWITHGDQVEEQAAVDCVGAALDEGITTFDTADAYAGGRAEEVLGRALHGLRRESLEIFTKVYWPTGDKPNDRGLSRYSDWGRSPTRPGSRSLNSRWRGRCRTRTCPPLSSAPPGPNRCGRTSRRRGFGWTPG